MIAWQSVWAIVLRHMRVWRRDFNYALMGFYWPMLDILIWGFFGSWIQQTAHFPNYETAALLGILLWQVVGRGCNIMVFTLAEELWANNMVNLFSLPLTIVEWMIGSVLFYGIMSTIISLFCVLVIALLYNVSVWYILTTFTLFMVPLFICGVWLGFTCLQIIMLFGKRGVELGFIIGWALLPFCGAYYPIDVLPAWGQALSIGIPMSYIFQGMRGYVMHNQDPTAWLIKGTLIAVLYACIAIVVFVYCFNRSKQKGLARLSD